MLQTAEPTAEGALCVAPLVSDQVRECTIAAVLLGLPPPQVQGSDGGKRQKQD